MDGGGGDGGDGGDGGGGGDGGDGGSRGLAGPSASIPPASSCLCRTSSSIAGSGLLSRSSVGLGVNWGREGAGRWTGI